MSNLTATVEVLTAEVRTLMVGNRQVTQSVYKQLDWIEPEHVKPFGRSMSPCPPATAPVRSTSSVDMWGPGL